MNLSKSTLKSFLKIHMKADVIENTFFNRSKEEKIVDKYYKDLITRKKAFIPASEAEKGVDISFNDQLNMIYEEKGKKK